MATKPPLIDLALLSERKESPFEKSASSKLDKVEAGISSIIQTLNDYPDLVEFTKHFSKFLSEISENEMDFLSIGLDNFTAIEANLAFIFNLAMTKLGPEALKDIILLYIAALRKVKSNFLLMMLIRVYDKHRDELKDFKEQEILDNRLSQFSVEIPCVSEAVRNKEYTPIDLKDAIKKEFKDFVDGKIKYYVANTENLLCIFVLVEQGEKNYENYYALYDFKNSIVSSVGKLKTEKDKKIKFFNCCVRNCMLYLFYAYESEKTLNSTVYTTFDMNEIDSKAFAFEKEITNVFNDQKFLYIIHPENCLSVLKFSNQITDLGVFPFESNIEFKDFVMHNTFAINNLLLAEKGKEDDHYLLSFTFNKEKKSYILTFKTNSSNKLLPQCTLSYGSNTFVLLQLDQNKLYFKEYSQSDNKLVESLVNLYPYDYICYHNSEPSNIYEYLIYLAADYSNLFGNLSFMKVEKSVKNASWYFAMNINNHNIKFLEKKIISESTSEEERLIYIILMKQACYSLYYCDHIEHEKFSDFNKYFNKFLLNYPENTQKTKKKILKELAEIEAKINFKLISVNEIKELLTKLDRKENFSLVLKFLKILVKTGIESSEDFNTLCGILIDLDNIYLQNFMEMNQKFISKNFKSYSELIHDLDGILQAQINKSNEKFFKDSLLLVLKDNNTFLKNLSAERIKIINKFALLKNTFKIQCINVAIKNIQKEKLFTISNELQQYLVEILLILENTNFYTPLNEHLELSNLFSIDKNFLSITINYGAPKTTLVKLECDCEIKDYNFIVKYYNDENAKQLTIAQSDLSKKREVIITDKMRINIKKEQNIEYKNFPFKLTVVPIKNLELFIAYRNNRNKVTVDEIRNNVLNYMIELFSFQKKQIMYEQKKLKNEFSKFSGVKLFYNISYKAIDEKLNENNTPVFELMKHNSVEINLEKEAKEPEEDSFFGNIFELEDQAEGKGGADAPLIKIENIDFLKVLPAFIKEKMNKEYQAVYEQYNNEISKYETTIMSYKDVDWDAQDVKDAILFLNKELEKKNRMLAMGGEQIKPVLLKVFAVVLKYYNYNNKFLRLCADIKEKKKILSDIGLFLNIYAACNKIKFIFNEAKSKFDDQKYDEELAEYLSKSSERIDFIHKIILPSFDKANVFEQSIVDDLLELVRKDLLKNMEFLRSISSRNMLTLFKINQVHFINALLMGLKHEESLVKVLQFINNQLRVGENPVQSLMANLHCIDYTFAESIQNNFHLMVNLLRTKVAEEYAVENYDERTKLLIYLSFLFEIKKRDFRTYLSIPELFNKSRTDLIFRAAETHQEMKRIELAIYYSTDKHVSKNLYELKKTVDVEATLSSFFKVLFSLVITKIKEIISEENKNVVVKREESAELLNIAKYSSVIIEDDYSNLYQSTLSFFSKLTADSFDFAEKIDDLFSNFVNNKQILEFILNHTEDFFARLLYFIVTLRTEKHLSSKIKIAELFLQSLEILYRDEKYLADLPCFFEALSPNEKSAVFNAQEPNHIGKVLFDIFLKQYRHEKDKILLSYYSKIIMTLSEKLPDEKESIKSLIKSNVNEVLSIIQLDYQEQDNHKLAVKSSKLEDCAIITPLVSSVEDTFETSVNRTQKQKTFTLVKNVNVLRLPEKEDVDFKENGVSHREENIVENFYDEEKTNSFLQRNSKTILNSLLDSVNAGEDKDPGKFTFTLKLNYNMLEFLNPEEVKKTIKLIRDLYSNFDFDKKDFCSLESLENIIDLNQMKMENKNDSGNKNSINDLLKFELTGKELSLYYKNFSQIKVNFAVEHMYLKLEDFENDGYSLSYYNSTSKSECILKEKSFLFIQNLDNLEETVKFIEANVKNFKILIVKNEKDFTKLSDAYKKLTILSIAESAFSNIVNVLAKEACSDENVTNLFGKNKIFMNFQKNFKISPNKKAKIDEDDGYFNTDFLFDPDSVIHEEKEEIDIKKDEDESVNKKQAFIDALTCISANVFEYENYKLAQRILIKLYAKNLLKDVEEINAFSNGEIISVFFDLMSEFYYNLSHSMPNLHLQKLLKEFLDFLFKKEKIILLEDLFSEVKKSNFADLINYEILVSKYRDKAFTERQAIDEVKNKYFCSLFALYPTILKQNIDLSCNSKILEVIFQNMKDVLANLCTDKTKKNKQLNVELFCRSFYEFLEIIYDEVKNGGKNSDLFVKMLEKFDFERSIRDLSTKYVDIDNYLNEKKNEKISKYVTTMLRATFRYLDIVYIYSMRKNETKYIEGWSVSHHNLIRFYTKYKILTVEKTYQEPDSKEMLGYIAYNTGAHKPFYDAVDFENNIKKSVKLSKNDLIKLSFDNVENKEMIATIINQTKDVHKQFKKIAVFSHSKKLNNYYLVDIIDTSKISFFNRGIQYSTKIYGNTLYLKPFDLIDTELFSFGENYCYCLGQESLNKVYKQPEKVKDFPKYTWNVEYGNNFAVCVSEQEKSKAFSAGNGLGAGVEGDKLQTFSELNKINDAKNFDYIIAKTGNCNATLLLDNANNLYGIGDNKLKIFGKIPDKQNNNNNIEKITVPLLIPIPDKTVIANVSIGYNNCFIISDQGLGYGIGKNNFNQISNKSGEDILNWQKVELPKNCLRFVDCAIGENFFIYLIENSKGEMNAYACGANSENECGINVRTKEEKISVISPITFLNDVPIKKIFARNKLSLAISREGELFIWGSYGKRKALPQIANFLDDKLIVDDAAISTTHILIIARERNEDYYKKRLYFYGFEECFHEEGIEYLPKLKLTEINLPEHHVPMRLSIGQNVSFILTVNEQNLLDTLTQNKESEIKPECEISYDKIVAETHAQKLVNFYNSEHLIKFINVFQTVTNSALKGFVDTFDEIRLQMENDASANHVYLAADFAMFNNYLKQNQKIKDLCILFGYTLDGQYKVNDIQLKDILSIFGYLKEKYHLISDEIMHYCNVNEHSEDKSFLQQAIGTNINYMSLEHRLKIFREKLDKLHKSNRQLGNARIDRFKALKFYDLKKPDTEFKETVFSQLLSQVGKYEGARFLVRSNFRLFMVQLSGEHASDSGGPYHETISNMCDELQTDSLDLFIKTPNHMHDYGNLRDKFIPNPEGRGKKYEEAYVFLGKMMASSVSSGEALDLNFHPVIWKGLLGNETTFFDYESIDMLFHKLMDELEEILRTQNEESLQKYELNFTIKNSAGVPVDLEADGKDKKVTMENLGDYIELAKKIRLKEFTAQLDFIKEGFNSVIPPTVFQVLNFRQLEEKVCGKAKLDVADLKKHTCYEGFKSTDKVIVWFWEWIESIDEEEQSNYLKFISGRSRLPKSENFDYRHTICRLESDFGNFPHSSTCFFQLRLPNYSNKELMVERLHYAIGNCAEIDGDR